MSTAARHYKEQLSSEYVRLKSYFYVLRPVLACKWILAEGTPPPVPFSQLADKYLDASMKPTIQQLLKMKINTPELGKEKRIELLHQYLEKNMQDIQNEIRNLPAEESIGWDDLNRLFLSLF